MSNTSSILPQEDDAGLKHSQSMVEEEQTEADRLQENMNSVDQRSRVSSQVSSSKGGDSPQKFGQPINAQEFESLRNPKAPNDQTRQELGERNQAMQFNNNGIDIYFNEN